MTIVSYWHFCCLCPFVISYHIYFITSTRKKEPDIMCLSKSSWSRDGLAGNPSVVTSKLKCETGSFCYTAIDADSLPRALERWETERDYKITINTQYYTATSNVFRRKQQHRLRRLIQELPSSSSQKKGFSEPSCHYGRSLGLVENIKENGRISPVL